MGTLSLDDVLHQLEHSPGQHPSARRFVQVLIDMAALSAKKQRDYGRVTDPSANVRASELWGIPAWKGALLRAGDKVTRLQTYSTTGTLANEGVEDSLIDLAVYAVIALVLWREAQGNSHAEAA